MVTDPSGQIGGVIVIPIQFCVRNPWLCIATAKSIYDLLMDAGGGGGGTQTQSDSSRNSCHQACSPPAGTKCYIGPHSNHSHGGMQPHYHLFQMNQNSQGKCFWNRAGTVGSPPAGVRPCSSYPGGPT
jgi:hypothetical protein